MGNITNDLFGIDIAGIVNDSIESAGGVLDATLFSVTPQAPPSGNSITPSTPTQHACKGFIDDYKDSQIDGTIIRKGDRKVTLLGASIKPPVAPKTNDQVTIEGDTYDVQEVTRDPAGATYELQAR